MTEQMSEGCEFMYDLDRWPYARRCAEPVVNGKVYCPMHYAGFLEWKANLIES